MTTGEQQWADRTLDSLSPEQRLAQLLILPIGNDAMHARVLDVLDTVPLGGVFLAGYEASVARARIEELQKKSVLPLIVAGDLECGACLKGLTRLPSPLALSAAGSEDLAYRYGRATAIEGRASGFHWTYAPVTDVNRNPENPITCTRSYGDDPERVGRMARAVIRGMQDHGLAACPKHFPGDGIDDVDQHVTTSVNRLSREEWLRCSGRAFREAYAAGAWSTMVGHIALPAWDDSRNETGLHCPATLSAPILTGLLRGEMGFDGLIVTDDMSMGGVGGYVPRPRRVPGVIAAGCDMYLFPDMSRDYRILLDATASGVLPRNRVDDACRRVLHIKQRLGLHEGRIFTPPPTAEQTREFQALDREIARRSLTLVRDVRRQLPVRLANGARVLTVTLSFEGKKLDRIDQALRDRGLAVEHIDNPDSMDFVDHAAKFDAVFINFGYHQVWGTMTVRPAGTQNRIFFKGLITDHPCIVYTSFGSPYMLRYHRGLPNFLNAYSDGESSQEAAVAAWFGEIDARAESPVGNLTVD